MSSSMNTSDSLSLVFKDPSTIMTGGDFTKTTIAVLYRSSGYVSNQLCCSPEYTWVTTDLTKLKSLEIHQPVWARRDPQSWEARATEMDFTSAATSPASPVDAPPPPSALNFPSSGSCSFSSSWCRYAWLSSQLINKPKGASFLKIKHKTSFLMICHRICDSSICWLQTWHFGTWSTILDS